jgi:hypothetical protein
VRLGTWKSDNWKRGFPFRSREPPDEYPFKSWRTALFLHFAWYNFRRVHSSLRVTPAMAVGILDEIWPIVRLLF